MHNPNELLKRITHICSTALYLLASLSLILAAFCMIFKSLHDLYLLILIDGQVSKDIINTISYTIVAIAVFDVGRYLLEEEVQREKELRLPMEVRHTLTRFMVVISIALSLEGLVGVFEMGNREITNLLYPVAVVLCAVLVMLGLGLYQRLSIGSERLMADSQSSDS